jgi:hypothetical protein
VPALGLLGGVPFANRVQPHVLGLPFFLFWIVAWVLTTSAIMALILSLDTAREVSPAQRTEPNHPANLV